MFLRLASLLILVVSSILLPIYVSLVIFVILVAVYNRYFEGLITALVLDTLYFSPVLFDKYHLGFFTVNFLVTFLFMEMIKKIIAGRNIIAQSMVAFAGVFVFTFLFLIFTYILV